MDLQSIDDVQHRFPGELDPAFGNNGKIEIDERGTVNAITCEKDGKLIVASQIGRRFMLSCYEADGRQDALFETIWNFEDGDKSIPRRVLLQDDGKILLIGESFVLDVCRPAVTRFNQQGSPDLVFGRRVINSHAHATPPFNYKLVDGCLQANQGILISVNNASQGTSYLYCLQRNGEDNPEFGYGQGFIQVALHDEESYVCNVAVQGNGDIVVAGSWRYRNEQKRIRSVACYSDKGVLRHEFGRGGYADLKLPDEYDNLINVPVNPDIVSRIAVQTDDRILLTGYTLGPDGLRQGLLARLEKDGRTDDGFNDGNPLLISRDLNDLTLNSLALQPDGKIVAVGRGMMAGVPIQLYERISTTGVSEPFWGGNSIGDCNDVTIQPSGRIVVCGSSAASLIGPHTPLIWGRLGSDTAAADNPRKPGDPDPAFGSNGLIDFPFEGNASTIASDTNGRLLVAIYADNHFSVRRYLADGALDTHFTQFTGNFQAGDHSVPIRLVIQKNGKILLFGHSIKDDVLQFGVIRLNDSGSQDLVLGNRILKPPLESATVPRIFTKRVDSCLTPDGKIIIAGSYSDDRRYPCSRLFCLQPNGDPEPTFGEGLGFIDLRLHGFALTNAHHVQIQSDDSIIVAGEWHETHMTPPVLTVARYDINGTLDRRFGVEGFADLSTDYDNFSDGLDNTTPLPAAISRVVVQGDDKIVIASRAVIFRLDKDGSADLNFNKGRPVPLGSLLTNITSVIILPSGSLVAVGYKIDGRYGVIEMGWIISQDGMSIQKFDTDEFTGQLHDVLFQTLGRIVVAGCLMPALNEPNFPRVRGLFYI